MAPQKPSYKVKYKWILQGFYNHLNAAFYVSGAVLDDEHEYTYFHDAYNLVRKTDMYQVTYK